MNRRSGRSRRRNFTFEDRFAGQDVLFGSEVDIEPLRDYLCTHFAGQASTSRR
jgi:hypothetical protein